MAEYESGLVREFSKYRAYEDVERKVRRLALISDGGKGETIIRCLAQRFADAYYYLSCVDSSPLEALIKFTKFTCLIGAKDKLRMLPDFGHLFLWLEVFTSISFFLMASIYEGTEFTFFLPGSYLAEVNFVDASFDRGRQTIQEGVANLRLYPSKSSFIHQRIGLLLGLLCKYKSRMNMLHAIFQLARKSGHHSHYCVAERLMVLVLTLVCNVEQSVALDCEPSLMGAISGIDSGKNCPKHLKQAVIQAQSATGQADLAKVLLDLLTIRNDSFYQCFWQWDKRSRQGVKSQKITRLSCFCDFFRCEDTLEAMKQAESYQGEYDVDDIDVEDVGLTIEEKLKYHQEQESRKRHQTEENASRIITRCLRKHMMRQRLQNLKSRVEENLLKQELYDRQKLFESIIIDNTMCGFCGIHFKVLPVEEVEKEITDITAPETNSVSQSIPETNVQLSIMSQVRNSHVQQQQHIQKLLEFNVFKMFYKTKIATNLQEISLFIDKYELKSEKQEEMFPNMLLEIQRLIRNRDLVKSELQRIIDNKDWMTRTKLEGANAEMRSDFTLVETYVVEQYEVFKKNELYFKLPSRVPCTRLQPLEDWDAELVEDVVKVPDNTRARKRVFRAKKH